MKIKESSQKTFITLTALVAGSSGLLGGVIGGTLISKNQQETTPTTAQVSQTSTTTSVVNESLADVVAQISSSVVEINTVIESESQGSFRRSQTAYGAGSGVIVTEDGYIVTNYHVIDSATQISVRLQNGEEYTARLINDDEEQDLALLKIDETNLNTATFEDSDTLRVGQTTLAIGNPLGTLGGTVTEGILSATDREITIDEETMNLLQTSAAINSGNSGGGLFDDAGHLIGIVNAKSSGLSIEGLGFAIPSNTVQDFLTQSISISTTKSNTTA
ncbi:hypothetical protein AOC36_07240 [Erysipelothrix larvae]|uniref:Serine protease n=1 Tax=Erysipelothrix larvae TaxID=1514105 RepID=A0A120JTS3_9FIRM|nr:trypsin-like peptidase domain-containing protein [Erysipelothrix larvae]AMC93783.1 hypothetical protein AOC36_07240 [Erysipelothrix larvae]